MIYSSLSCFANFLRTSISLRHYVFLIKKYIYFMLDIVLFANQKRHYFIYLDFMSFFSQIIIILFYVCFFMLNIVLLEKKTKTIFTQRHCFIYLDFMCFLFMFFLWYMSFLVKKKFISFMPLLYIILLA
jgi:hypothetical protein